MTNPPLPSWLLLQLKELLLAHEQQRRGQNHKAFLTQLRDCNINFGGCDLEGEPTKDDLWRQQYWQTHALQVGLVFHENSSAVRGVVMALRREIAEYQKLAHNVAPPKSSRKPKEYQFVFPTYEAACAMSPWLETMWSARKAKSHPKYPK